jgi:hypothetical protein
VQNQFFLASSITEDALKRFPLFSALATPLNAEGSEPLPNPEDEIDEWPGHENPNRWPQLAFRSSHLNVQLNFL